MPKSPKAPASEVKKTGSVFRRDEAGALIECASYCDEENGRCWTEETVIEPAPEPEPAPAPEGEPEPEDESA